MSEETIYHLADLNCDVTFRRNSGGLVIWVVDHAEPCENEECDLPPFPPQWKRGQMLEWIETMLGGLK